MRGIPATLCALLLSCSGAGDPAGGQDVEYNQAVHAAQRERPAQLSSRGRIAPEDEPGTRLRMRGRVFAADGRTPLADAILFAYHTDRDGVYRARGEPVHTWRLKGWVRTDQEGRFEFESIRPGPYPGGQEAAHVHLTIFTPEGSGHHAEALLFDDDPLVRDADRAASRAAGEFGLVCKVRYEGDAQLVDFNLRLDPRQKF